MKNLIIIIAVVLFTALAAQADVRKIKFINNEGKDVDDLHIEFEKNNVDWDRDAPHSFDNVRHDPPGDKKYNFWGTTVTAGDTVELTFESDHDIVIAEWWWTKGGTALKDGDKVGKSKKDNGGKILVFNGGAAAGNGMYLASVGGQTRMFQTVPGMMPAQTMNIFMGFLLLEFNLNNDSLVYFVPKSPDTLYVAGNNEGDTITPLVVQVMQPDFNQQLTIQQINPSILSLTEFIEGRFIPGQNKMDGDYIDVYFRSPIPPFNVLSTATCFLDSNGRGDAWTYSIPNGQPFFIQVNHRNSIETWSSNGNKMFINGRCVHNFALSPTSAFGANLKQMGNRFCVYSGDVNQDGVIDGTDMSAVDNDAANYAIGYLPTDLNGDEAVDATDYAITDNNANNFVGAIRP